MVIVIPDVHGRNFWKKAVEGNEDKKIIFLGDYLDPYYEDENAYKDINDVIKNFKEIIDFKKAHPKNVTLLVGNHDAHYFIDEVYYGSRFNRFYAREIKSIFLENIGLFKMCTSEMSGGKKFVFSHAGIHKRWLDSIYGEGEWDKKTIIRRINTDILVRCSFGVRSSLNFISSYRDGIFDYGSMIWADIREFLRQETCPVGDYQIVGHTMLTEPVALNTIADLDCNGRAFKIKNGKIFDFEDNEIKKRNA